MAVGATEIATGKIREAIKYNGAYETLCFLGGIGIGKTAAVQEAYPELYPELVRQVAEARGITIEPEGFEFFERRAGEYDVLDYAGMPVPVALDDGVKVGKPQAYLQKRAQSDLWPGAGQDKKVWGVLFLDEFPQADRIKQTVMQRAFDAGYIGDWVVPGHPKSDPNCERGLVFIVLAGNRQSDRANSHGIGWQTANRLLQYNVVSEPVGWMKWAIDHGVHPAVIALVKFYPEYLHKVDHKQKSDLQACPTPRSLVKLSDATYRDLPREIEFSTYAGLVGEECARAYLAMLDASRGVDFEAILRGDPMTAPIPGQAAHQYGVAAALTRYVEDDTFSNVISYLSRVGDGDFVSPELLVFAVEAIVQKHPHLCETPEFTAYALKYTEFRA